MTLILALWAWVLPYAAPVLRVGGSLLARVKGRGNGAGGWGWPAVVGIAAALVLGVVVWRTLIDPPEPTYTSAQVNADRLARENEMLRRAAEEQKRIVAQRDMALLRMEVEKRGIEDENEQLRARMPAATGAAFTDDDPWLQRKRARSGQAGPRADRR